MEKHLPNFKYVMHWKKYLFFSAGNSASGLAFSSVYVCVRGWSPSCLRRAARPWMAELASSTTPWKAGDSPAAQQDEVQLVEDHAAVIYCNFQGVSFSAIVLNNLSRDSANFCIPISVFNPRFSFVVKIQGMIWKLWENASNIVIIEIALDFSFVKKNLLYKSWVKVSYLFFECFWKCKREALKVSNSFSSL